MTYTAGKLEVEVLVVVFLKYLRDLQAVFLDTRLEWVGEVLPVCTVEGLCFPSGSFPVEGAAVVLLLVVLDKVVGVVSSLVALDTV